MTPEKPLMAAKGLSRRNRPPSGEEVEQASALSAPAELGANSLETAEVPELSGSLSLAAPPFVGNGSDNGFATAVLDDVFPVGPRRCRSCGEIVTTGGNRCSNRRCRKFLVDNTASLKDGRRSKKALRQAREERYASLCQEYAGADGAVPKRLRDLLWTKAVLLAQMARGVEWSEGTSESLTSEGHMATHAMIVKYAGELRQLEDDIREMTHALEPADLPPLMIVDELTSEDIERIRAQRDADTLPPSLRKHLDAPDSSGPFRMEHAEKLALVQPDDAQQDDPAPVAPVAPVVPPSPVPAVNVPPAPVDEPAPNTGPSLTDLLARWSMDNL